MRWRSSARASVSGSEAASSRRSVPTRRPEPRGSRKSSSPAAGARAGSPLRRTAPPRARCTFLSSRMLPGQRVGTQQRHRRSAASIGGSARPLSWQAARDEGRASARDLRRAARAAAGSSSVMPLAGRTGPAGTCPCATSASRSRLVAATKRTSIGRGLTAADAQHLARLEHAQQLGLHRQRQLADLVEEHGAAVGASRAGRAWSASAPVNAPFSWPNSSLSSSVSVRPRS